MTRPALTNPATSLARLATHIMFGCVAAALFLWSQPVRADEPKKDWTLNWNIGATTDYVFRGVSQTAEKPTLQGGADVTYKMFYAGVWMSAVQFSADPAPGVGVVEVDLYAGVKFPIGKMLEADLGVIYYAYPGAGDTIANGFRELDYVELKAGAKFKPVDPLTIGAFVFFTPEGTNKTGQVMTLEGSVEYVFPKFGVVTPSVSALVGYQKGDDARYALIVANGRDNYTYWNAGIALGVGDNLSFDVRYWDTNISDAGRFCTGATFQCNERVVGTVKITF